MEHKMRRVVIDVRTAEEMFGNFFAALCFILRCAIKSGAALGKGQFPLSLFLSSQRFIEFGTNHLHMGDGATG